MITVTVRSAGIEPGYLLSVEKRNASGGATIWPGPKCSSLETALRVAKWIECNLPIDTIA